MVKVVLMCDHKRPCLADKLLDACSNVSGLAWTPGEVGVCVWTANIFCLFFSWSRVVSALARALSLRLQGRSPIHHRPHVSQTFLNQGTEQRSLVFKIIDDRLNLDQCRDIRPSPTPSLRTQPNTAVIRLTWVHRASAQIPVTKGYTSHIPGDNLTSTSNRVGVGEGIDAAEAGEATGSEEP